MPIVSLVEPILSVALSLTLVVQGFVSVRIGVQQAKSFKDLGIAGVIAGVLVVKGSGHGVWQLVYWPVSSATARTS